FRSIRTRAPWVLTFSVDALSLSIGSSSRHISTFTTLAIRFSDRPLNANSLVRTSLRSRDRMSLLVVVTVRDWHPMSYVETRILQAIRQTDKRMNSLFCLRANSGAVELRWILFMRAAFVGTKRIPD